MRLLQDLHRLGLSFHQFLLPIQLVISSLSRETSQATSLAAKGCIVSEQLPSISGTYLAISNHFYGGWTFLRALFKKALAEKRYALETPEVRRLPTIQKHIL